jgi:hypothetical protein
VQHSCSIPLSFKNNSWKLRGSWRNGLPICSKLVLSYKLRYVFCVKSYIFLRRTCHQLFHTETAIMSLSITTYDTIKIW